MFLHLCVILFTVGEGGLCQEDPPDKEPPDRDPSGHKSPWTETPQTENPPGRKAPRQRPPPDREPPPHPAGMHSCNKSDIASVMAALTLKLSVNGPLPAV